jgi:hypothetical protein
MMDAGKEQKPTTVMHVMADFIGWVLCRAAWLVGISPGTKGVTTIYLIKYISIGLKHL